jgi:hypothetical protein
MLSTVAKLSLTPFEIRFKDLLSCLAQQDEVIRHEVQIVHLEVSMTQLMAQESASKMERENTQGVAQPIAVQKNKADAILESKQALHEERRDEYTRKSEKAVQRLRSQAAGYVEQHNEQERIFEKGLWSVRISAHLKLTQ